MIELVIGILLCSAAFTSLKYEDWSTLAKVNRERLIIPITRLLWIFWIYSTILGTIVYLLYQLMRVN